MALKKCKECGQDVSTDAKSCPHCGKKLKTSSCGIIVLVMIIVILGLTNIGKFSKQSAIYKSLPPKINIPFEIVGSSELLSNSSIVIDKKYVNSLDMMSLGLVLKYDCRDMSIANINIFKNMDSALFLTPEKMMHYSSNLNDNSGNRHYRNLIGKYEKNTNTGHHRLGIMYEGMLGNKNEDIPY
ncbi:MAG: zinc ribbon domain-containing protein [Candidatus Cloacimonetes bacterium]|nr:zinc ribbon domain-containing protein [Candidatus Cloacimonadota bacterium]